MATAAMGSSMTAELSTLRALRDRLLLRFDAGRAFVKYYYTHGPRWAKALEANPRYKPLVRALLWPVVLTCRVAFFSDAFDKILIVFLIVLFAALVLRSRKLFRTSLRKGFGVTIVVALVVMCYGVIMDVHPARASNDELEEVDPAYLTGDLYHFHEDHIGRPFMMTDTKEDDSNPDMVWYADFYPFGEVMYEVGSIEIGDVTTTGINYQPAFRFPGQYEDEETGLVYNWNRYYIPEIGRYNRVDPVSSYADNIYVYAMNNPIIFIDPLGLAVYKGDCVLTSGGFLVGGAVLRCDVSTACDDRRKKQTGKLTVIFAGLTWGWPVGMTTFQIAQRDHLPGIGHLYSMGGDATLVQWTVAYGDGVAGFFLELGDTLPTLTIGKQMGVDASVDVLQGGSYVTSVEEVCCEEWEK